MASLANQTISSTYDGLIKTSSDNAVPVSGVQALEDGSGNALALSVGRSGNGVSVSGNLAVDTNTLYVDAANNRVGVGESSPSRPLHISADTPAIRLEDTTGSDYSELVSVNGDLYIRADEGNTQADSTIRFQLDQSEAMRIDSSGNVGVKGNALLAAGLGYAGDTTSAGAGKIELYDTSTGALIIDGFGAGYLANSGIHFQVAGSEKMRIDSSGNVGIGTSSPNVEMEIASAAPQIRLTDTDGGYCEVVNVSGNLLLQADKGNAQSGSYMRFDVDGSERMRIDSSGNVILNTGGSFTTGTTNSLRFSPSNSLDRYASINVENDGSNNLSMYFETRDAGVISERMRIDSSGNVGINCSPSGKLHIQADSNYVVTNSGRALEGIIINTVNSAGNGNYGGAISFGTGSLGSSAIAAVQGTTDSDANGLAFFTHGSGSSSADADERMRITNAGDVLIGTQNIPNGSPYYGAGFSPLSDNRMFFRTATSTTSASNLIAFYNPNGQVGTISTSGSSTAYNTSSDYRLKENVVEMTGALDRVDALKPSRFNFIADPEKTVDGFLAHEVQAIVPEAVTGEKDAVDEEGNPIYQGIDQSKIVPLLVGAIKELRAEIELLKAK